LQEHPLTPELQTITELSLESLIAKLQSRELLATKVLSAYTAKALEVNENFNCITEFVPQAVVSLIYVKYLKCPYSISIFMHLQKSYFI
jgi:hypothetical protein